MRRWAPPLVVTALLVAGCSAAPADAPPEVDIGFGHVHGVGLNPADDLLYAATHTGVFRLDDSGPQRIADRYQDTMGFAVVGPDRFLASGHPDPNEPGPVHLGLVVSDDAAQTWRGVSLVGEADFHAISATGSTIYGYDSLGGQVMRSDDSGSTWESGLQIAAADLAVDPQDPQRVVLTTERGLLVSEDGGRSAEPPPMPSPRPLLLVDQAPLRADRSEPVLAGVDTEGGVWVLDGSQWSAVGTLPGPPEAFAVVGVDRMAAATAEGVFDSTDGGRSWVLVAPASG